MLTGAGLFGACEKAPTSPPEVASPRPSSSPADAALSDAVVADAAAVPVSHDAAAPSAPLIDYFESNDGTDCAVTANGDAIAWTAGRRQRANIVAALGDVSRVACSQFVTCGKSEAGWRCVGRLSFGSGVTAGTPLAIPSSNAADLVPFLDGICILSGGSLVCWGDLGSHFAVGSAPRRVEVARVIRFVVGGQWALILTERGDVYCWGRNWEGVCGGGPWGAFVAPRRIATAIVDVAADRESAWLLRRDGVVLGSGHVQFASQRRKEHVPRAPEGDDFFYSDVPIPVTLPGRAKRILRVDCVELESGEAGCAYDKWYPRTLEELKPCRAEEGVVKCGEKVVPLRW